MSLLDTYLRKKQESLQVAQSTGKVTLSEKIALAQSHAIALKKQIDTNIKELDDNAATGLKTALQPHPHVKKLSFAELLAQKAQKTNTLPSQPTVPQVQAIIKEEVKKLSLAEILALRKETNKAIAEQLEETTGNINAPLFPEIVKAEDTDLVGNVKEKLAVSLLERLKAKARTEGVRKEEPTQVSVPQEQYQQQLQVVQQQELEALRIQQTNAHAVVENDEGKVIEPEYTTFSLDISLNEKQQSSVDFIPMNKSFVVLGAAGTGKTTSERAMMHKILESPEIKSSSFKVSGDLRMDAPSVAIVAYTRRAASNSAKAILRDPALKEQLPHNIMTIHALLEFIPEEYYDMVDNKQKFRFAPQRTSKNPLTITHLIIEEATLLGLDLWEQLFDALPYDVQIIYVGDINQLPPVFGPSILNYALTKLPVIELTQVYRQAEGSPIINNAHRILKGEAIEEGVNEQGKLVVVSGKSPVSVGQAKTAAALGIMFEQYYNMGLYNPEEDMILSPWNKQELGTDSLNKYISEFLSKKNNTVVYELIAGFNKLYLGINDKVMYNKRDAIIVDIEPNPAYVGMQPQHAGTDLSRWGVRRIGEGSSMADAMDEGADAEIDYSNFSLEMLEETAMERKMQCSHRVTVAFDDGSTTTLSAVGDYAPAVFSLGYALTVHKSQGSEWRRVFIVFHKSHAVSLTREMLYTAITRAREEVYLIAKADTLLKAVANQRVKGNTLKDKIEYFNSGVQQNDSVQVIKQSIQNKYN